MPQDESQLLEISEKKPLGPYIAAKEAAEYCGYTYGYFRRLAADYKIPKRGPGGNRYATKDLDIFMNDPMFFNKEHDKKYANTIVVNAANRRREFPKMPVRKKR